MTMFELDLLPLPSLKQENGPRRHYVSEELGIKLPSITTVLGKTGDKSFLDTWRAKVGEEEAKRISLRASARGTAMHNLCEHLIRNETVELSDNEVANNLFKPCREYLTKHITKVHGIECGLYSTKLGIAGTNDLMAYHDGELASIDYKSSDKFKKEEWIDDYFMQAAFYALAFYELTGLMPKKTVIMIAVEAHEDWRGVKHDWQIQEFIHRGSQIKEDIQKLIARRAEYTRLFPPAPERVFG